METKRLREIETSKTEREIFGRTKEREMEGKKEKQRE